MIDFILLDWETQINHVDQVLSPRYFFLQRTITEHDSVFSMRGKEQAKNYSASSFFGSTICYFYRSIIVWFSRGRKLHSAGEQLIDFSVVFTELNLYFLRLIIIIIIIIIISLSQD